MAFVNSKVVCNYYRRFVVSCVVGYIHVRFLSLSHQPNDMQPDLNWYQTFRSLYSGPHHCTDEGHCIVIEKAEDNSKDISKQPVLSLFLLDVLLLELA